MAMGTRSKAREETTAVTGKKEQETSQVTDKGQEISQRSEPARTDIVGVKIKKELIEENLPAGLTETAAFPDDSEGGLANKGQDEFSSLRKASGSLQTTRSKWNKSQVLGDRRSSVQAYGKRRLPAVSSRKRNRKYFQDIRLYAKSFRLAQTKESTTTVAQEDQSVHEANSRRAESLISGHILHSPKKNKGSRKLKYQGDGLAPNTDNDESASESELSDTGNDSDSSEVPAAFDGDDNDVSFEDSDEDIQDDGNSEDDGTYSPTQAKQINSRGYSERSEKSGECNTHHRCRDTVRIRDESNVTSIQLVDMTDSEMDEVQVTYSSTKVDQASSSFTNKSSGLSGEYHTHYSSSDTDRARDSSKVMSKKIVEMTDREMDNLNGNYSTTESAQTTSSCHSEHSEKGREYHTHHSSGDTARTRDASMAPSTHLVDSTDRSMYDVNGISFSTQDELNASSLTRDSPALSGESHPHHRNRDIDNTRGLLKEKSKQPTEIHTDNTQESPTTTSKQPIEMNDSEMEDVQLHSSAKCTAQPLDGLKRARTSAKVTFDGATKDTTQSSLRRHKKNHMSDDHTTSVEKHSVAPKIPQPLKAKFTVIAKSCATIEQQMKLRGLKMVEEKQLWETPVKLEFNIDRNTVEYNVRAQLLVLLRLLKAKDPTLKIKSATSNELMWSQLDMLPEDEAFTENFQIKDFLYRKMRKVVVHMTLLTSLHVNQLKYTEKVKEYIFQNNIWLKPDMFQTKVESSPGVLIMVHPKLTNRLQLTEDIKNIMQKAAKTLNLHSTTDDQKLTDISTSTGDVYKHVPQFYLELSVKKWGNLRVEVIRINCAKDDAEYIKYLLSSSGEQGSLQKCVFLPEGLHLMEGKELVYNMLQEHDQFIREVTGVPIRGITYNDLSSVVPKTSKTIKDIIMNIPGVISIEKTRDRAFAEKLMVITKKSTEQSVVEKLSQKMEMFYSCQTGQTRIIMAGTQKIPHPVDQTNSVKTYAEILSARYQSVESGIPPSPIVPQQKVRQQSQGTTTKINEETHRPQTVQSTSGVNNQLEKKMEEMFAAQERIEQAQTRLQQEHNELKKADKTKHERADNNIQEDKIHQMMDKKLAEFKEEQKKQTEEHNAALRSEIGRSFDKKIDNISITVAQQVTSQLVELFHQYMSPKKQIESNIQHREKDTPLITQEPFNSPPDKKLQQGINGITTQEETVSPGDTAMLQALNAIETPSPIQRSPHDKISERMNTS